jgi:hypothetical protein
MKKRFTLEEHKSAAIDLREVRGIILDYIVKTSESYPHDVATKKLEKALSFIDEVRSSLDNQLFREAHPLTPDEKKFVYYGGGKR